MKAKTGNFCSINFTGNKIAKAKTRNFCSINFTGNKIAKAKTGNFCNHFLNRKFIK